LLRSAVIFLLFAGALFCVLMAVLVRYRRGATINRTLYSSLMLAVAIYALSYGVELNNAELPGMMWAVRAEYLGVTCIPALWLSLVFYYTGREKWVRPWRTYLLWVIPLIVLVAVYTNDLHHQFYTSISINQDGPFPMLNAGHGPVYWLHMAYSFVAFFGAAILLTRHLTSPHVLYRKQVVTLLIASLLTIVAVTLQIAGVTPIPGLDIIPFAMTCSGVILTWGVYNFRIIDVTPTARDVLFENLVDGVLVLDERDRLVDMNPKASRILALPPTAVGSPVLQILPEPVRVIYAGLNPDATNFDLALKNCNECHYEVSIFPFKHRSRQPDGRVMIFHDTTQYWHAQQALEASHAKLEQHAHELDEGRQAAFNLMLDAQSARAEAEQAYVQLQAQMDEIQTLQAQLREQAIRDPLTTCFNRRYLDETLEREFRRARREGYPICLAMADIDHFKKVNDTYGHPAGDQVLKMLGKLLRGCTRAGDIVCRYGGEEFLMMLPNIKEADALQRADEWRLAFQAIKVKYGEHTLQATISIGVACFPAHGQTKEEVLEGADQALYRAKQAGRNRVCAPVKVEG
jgi:diguanylate cyclase (GGDEF)-like protein